MSPAPHGGTVIRRRGQTIVPNATVFDDRLTLPALGVLVFLLARPENAPQGYRHLLGRGMGQKALLEAFHELGTAGYRHQVKHRDPDGRTRTYTVVSEDPITTEVAAAWLAEHRESLLNHADTGNAWSKQGRKRKAAGRTMRDVPGPRAPGPGAAPHKPSVSKGLSSLRSQDPEELPGDAPTTPIPADFRARREAPDS